VLHCAGLEPVKVPQRRIRRLRDAVSEVNSMSVDRSTLVRRKLAAMAGGAGVAVAGLAAGSAAYADVHAFDNSALDFDWATFTDLDVTRAPLDQGSADVQSSFYQYLYEWFGGGYSDIEIWLAPTLPTPGRFANYRGELTTFAGGDSIGPGAFTDSYAQALGASFYGYTGSDPWTLYAGDGTPDYLGLRFEDSGAALHYGWMQVLWNGQESRFDALAWGYETDEEKLIGAGDTGGEIPEPGTLALFAVGAVALAVARRRQQRRSSQTA
jgi:hypothetical protein